MATFCPYCDSEIETEVYEDWIGDYITPFDFECPNCGKEMEIEVEMEPTFYTKKVLRTTSTMDYGNTAAGI